MRFINDSKATNADAAEKALACYEAIYWIAGGSAEGGGDHAARAVFQAAAARLPDRHRDGGVCGDARQLGSLHALRRSCDRGGSGRRTGAPRRRGRARSCCCRRPAPPTTSSPISRRAAMPSAPWSPHCTRPSVDVPPAAGERPAIRRRQRAMMFARIDQRPVARWWWTVDRWSLGALRPAARLRRGAEHGGKPRRRRAARLSAIAFRRSPARDRADRACDHVRGVAAAAALGPPDCVRRFCNRTRAARSDLCCRGRDQGRAALDQPAGLFAAAIGIRQADLRRRRRLAVRRTEGAARISRQRDLDRAVPCARRDAGQTARSRHGGSRRTRLVRAILYGRAAALLGRRRHDGRAWRPGRRLSVAAARDQSDQPLPRPGGRAIPTRSTARSRPSSMAGCGAADPARARSRTFCPTRTPISCSRSPARSSG